MNKEILNEEVQRFINANLESEVPALMLKGIPFPEKLISEVITQIQSKKRTKTKLPTWYHSSHIYYPKPLSVEQSSSEIAAKYKAELVNGNSLIDLTGGLGVDSYFFSLKIKEVTHCEIHSSLSQLVTHNFKQFGRNNITCINNDGIDVLKELDRPFDWIYLDPARRDDKDKKVFLLSQCTPNATTFQNLFLKYSNNVMIKTSPLLDISATLNDLKNAKALHIVAIRNEVKELLWILEREYKGDLNIYTANILSEGSQAFNFKRDEESLAIPSYDEPQQYLYEPNSAILKSGAFNLLSERFQLNKLNKHSHLYTSKALKEFPGRCFKINKVLPYQKKLLLKEGIRKANITTRNFPVAVQDIRKKLKIKDGGDNFLFFTTDNFNNKIVIICSKL